MSRSVETVRAEIVRLKSARREIDTLRAALRKKTDEQLRALEKKGNEIERKLDARVRELDKMDGNDKFKGLF